jgi:hypothetical protein
MTGHGGWLVRDPHMRPSLPQAMATVTVAEQPCHRATIKVGSGRGADNVTRWVVTGAPPPVAGERCQIGGCEQCQMGGPGRCPRDMQWTLSESEAEREGTRGAWRQGRTLRYRATTP